VHRDAHLFGVDISAVMLETARAALVRAGLSDRVRIAEADATADDVASLFGRAGFDRVFFSYVLSMIPDWRAALARAVDALAPSGRLLVVDFGHQNGLPPAFKRALFAWLAPFHVHPIPDLREALGEIAVRRGLSI